MGWRVGLGAGETVQGPPTPTLPSTISILAGRAPSPGKLPQWDLGMIIHSQDTSS